MSGSEPVKVLPMAQLLRLSREKEERERLAREVDTQEGITQEAIPQKTVPTDTIAKRGIPKKHIPQQGISQKGIPVQTIPSKREALVNESKGYYASYNDISDRLIPELKLNTYEQSVLQRLYRLSRGWKSEECEVGLGTLAKYCVMSKTQAQRCIGSLIEKKLIVNLGQSKKGAAAGNRYLVLPGVSAIPSQAIPYKTIAQQETTIPLQNRVVLETIPGETTNKYSNKDLKHTHTDEPSAPGVGVGSKFTIEECRKYAQHLQATGQGINNPGGYATTIKRTGEADELIQAFLHPAAASQAVDVSACPDCQGSGFYYPNGIKGGVAKCKHANLKNNSPTN